MTMDLPFRQQDQGKNLHYTCLGALVKTQEIQLSKRWKGKKCLALQ